jgi:hypothetical protein
MLTGNEPPEGRTWRSASSSARVDRVKQIVEGIVGERTLGGEMVDRGAVEHASKTTSGIGPREHKGPIHIAVICHDLVAGWVVGLHKHRMIGPNGKRLPARKWTCSGKSRECQHGKTDGGADRHGKS